MIIFRADANKKMGMGHMLRCISIAKQLKRLGKDVLFLTADDSPAQLLADEKLTHIILDTDWMCMDEETDAVANILISRKAECMLVDSYFASPEYFESLNIPVRLLYMDDFGQKVYPADTVINANAYASAIDYRRLYDGTETKLLIGPMYAPLREAFSSVVPRPITDRIYDIMITTGSTDPFHVSANLIRRMICDKFFDNVRLHIVSGKYYKNSDELEQLSKVYPQVIVYRDMNDIWSLMTSCDAAISAGGTTVYELCACGVPTAIFGFVDNQTAMRRYFGSAGAMIDCGDIRISKDQCLNSMIDAVKTLADEGVRVSLRQKAKSITDGHGAKRIAEYIAESAKDEISDETG